MVKAGLHRFHSPDLHLVVVHGVAYATALAIDLRLLLLAIGHKVNHSFSFLHVWRVNAR